MKHDWFLKLLFILPLLLLSPTTWAKKPCAKDIKQFCSEVKGDRAKVMECLMQNKDKLSKKCQKKGLKRHQKARVACKADIEQFCKDVEPGQGRVINCLASHQDELSEDCRTSTKKQHRKGRMRKALKALHKACKADVKEHCSDIEAKNKKQKIKQTLLCLKEHKKELTETCTTKLKEAKKRFKNRKAKARVRKACGADIKKLCQDVKKDKDSIKSCLKANQEQVSQACKDLFQKEGKSKDDSSMVDTSLLQADDLVDTE